MKIKYLEKISLLLLLALSYMSCKKFAEPAGEIEKKYAARGTYATAALEIKNTSGKNRYKVHYPSPLTGISPLVVWGNGTGAGPGNYDEIFDHLASWGFIVIDDYDKNTGTGAGILAAAEYMLAENNNPSGPFYGKIDVQQVGAVGHSQGAAGILNAHTDFPGGSVFKTLVPVALPAPNLTESKHSYAPGLLTASLFLMSGKADGLISSAGSNTSTFDATPAGLPAAMALAAGTGHIAITKNGGRHRGYLTAWLRYRLSNDSIARTVFAGPDPELLRSEGWKDVRLKNLD